MHTSAITQIYSHVQTTSQYLNLIFWVTVEITLTLSVCVFSFAYTRLIIIALVSISASSRGHSGTSSKPDCGSNNNKDDCNDPFNDMPYDHCNVAAQSHHSTILGIFVVSWAVLTMSLHAVKILADQWCLQINGTAWMHVYIGTLLLVT